MDINWNLLQPVDVGGSFQQGFQQGEARKRQQAAENALAQVAQNPNEQNVNALLRYDPKTALAIQDSQFQRQKYQAQQQQQSSEELDKAIGQAALDVAMRPEAEQDAAWDAYVTQFSQRYPNARQFIGQRKTLLMPILAQAGLMGEYQKAREPRIMSVEPGGYVARMNRDGTGAQYIMTPDGAPVPGTEAPPQQSDPAPPIILSTAKQRGFITPEEVAALESQLGPNGREAMSGWFAQNRIPVGKRVGDRTYYQINGKWFDNPEGR